MSNVKCKCKYEQLLRLISHFHFGGRGWSIRCAENVIAWHLVCPRMKKKTHGSFSGGLAAGISVYPQSGC